MCRMYYTLKQYLCWQYCCWVEPRRTPLPPQNVHRRIPWMARTQRAPRVLYKSVFNIAALCVHQYGESSRCCKTPVINFIYWSVAAAYITHKGHIVCWPFAKIHSFTQYTLHVWTHDKTLNEHIDKAQHTDTHSTYLFLFFFGCLFFGCVAAVRQYWTVQILFIVYSMCFLLLDYFIADFHSHSD